MNDKELLEFAAKAHANVQWVDNIIETGYWDHDADDWWNPLTDDGDALRLAVKLGIKVSPYPFYESIKHSVLADKVTLSPDGKSGPAALEVYKGDKYAATRRAIVRAAAEIGKAM